MVLGQIALEGFDDGPHLPDEDARIPEKLPALEEGPGQFEVGLLGEALHLADPAVVRHLNVSVARFGTRGLDAHGHQGVVRRGEIHALADDGAEILLVEDQVVRRGHHHLGLGVALEQRIGRIGDAGRRVAAHGFAEDLLGTQFGEMLQHEFLVAAVGHHEEILRRDQFFEPFEGVADERFSRTQYVEELLGARLAAHGPEPGADASRHDDAIFVACHELSIMFGNRGQTNIGPSRSFLRGRPIRALAFGKDKNNS